MKDTAQALGLAPNTVSTLVASLMRSGMLIREPDEHDQRVAHLILTGAARAPLEAWRAHRLEAMAKAVAGLTTDQRRDLDAGLAVLQTIADQLAEASGVEKSADERPADD